MKKRKQIMLSSLLMLLVAAMALTSTTFAWFSKGDSGIVSDFEFTAESASGIQFSADAETWKQTITAIDIAEAKAASTTEGTAQYGSSFGTVKTTGTGETPTKLFVGSSFSPISSDGTTASGKMNFYDATQNTDGTINTTAIADNFDKYYKFNVYVNNMGDDTKSLVLSDFSVTAGTEDKGTQYATRIAVLDQGSTTKLDKKTDDIRKAAIALSGASKSVIIEPNSKAHTKDAENLLGATTTEKMVYWGVKAEKENLPTNRGFITESDGVSTVTTYDDKTKEVAVLDPNSISKITIIVWVEGQDIDCNNDVASGKVVVNMTFKAEEKKYSLTYDLGEDGKFVEGKAPATTQFKAGSKQDPIYDGETAGDTITPPTDKKFVGWTDEKDGTVAKFVKGDNKKIDMNADVILYAIYQDATT